MKKFNNTLAALAVVIAGLGIAFTFVPDVATAAKPAATAAAPKAAAADANVVVDKGWSERCSGKEKSTDKKACEVYTRLEMKTGGLRVTEVAIGFPQDNSLPKGTARGVIILPLGVMLEPGATMAVDDGKPFAFKSRFCTQSGCFAFVNMNKDILETMKNGKELNVFFKTADNHDAHLAMTLNGLDKLLSKIQ